MKKYYLYLNETIGPDCDTLLQRMNEQLTTTDNHIQLYLDSMGGHGIYGSMIIDLINNYADRITLIINVAQSAAFDIFIFTKCEKVISSHALGMLHEPEYENIKTRELKCNTSYKKAMDEFTTKASREDMQLYSKLFNKNIIKRYLKGEDVYFGHSEMVKINEKLKKINKKK